MRNGIPAAGLSEMAHEIRDDAAQGLARYGVALRWLSGTRAQVQTLPATIGRQRVAREFSWQVDEPRQLGGSNHAPNPQELLLSGLGACLMVGFAVGATVQGIQLSTLEVEVQATLDLAGFLDLRPGAPVPMTGIEYTMRVAGDGTREQYEQLRLQAEAHSPNAMSLKQGVPLAGRLAEA
jgi:uncharacterized OsmC-like protein